jgi:cytochrome c oxidase assembly protein subunit 11
MTSSFKMNPKYLFILVFAMIGLSFASVPLYDLFCRVTGFGGTTQKSEKPSEIIIDKIVKVRFDSNTNNDLPVNFKP